MISAAAAPIAGAQIPRAKLVESARQMGQETHPYLDNFRADNEFFLKRLDKYSGGTIGDMQANANASAAAQRSKERKAYKGLCASLGAAVAVSFTETYRLLAHHNVSHYGLAMGLLGASCVSSLAFMGACSVTGRKGFEAASMSKELTNWGAYLDKSQAPAAAVTAQPAAAQPALT